MGMSHFQRNPSGSPSRLVLLISGTSVLSMVRLRLERLSQSAQFGHDRRLLGHPGLSARLV
ncbi:hypothetical protein I7I51_04136 [Histoplasma capsulatum]|uniref:Uncharacterized protein n=1 Tax=Ajellomyces capsulatus TaxID=5037 RepID=A0A8A1M7F9_AJECA|nr:hypothetical protein I7I51_04136 [Histoplasma capsulatum]